MTYKDEQEAFVGNLHGTDLSDFIQSLALLPMAILLLEVAQGVSLRVNPIQDLLCLVLPVSLALTVLSDEIPLLLIVSSFAIMLLFIWKSKQKHSAIPPSTALSLATAAATTSSSCCNDLQTILPDTTVTQEPPSSSPDEKDKDKNSSRLKLSFITLFRGGNLLLTCMSILAIDFHVYPRRFGKTELYGFSLMDTGAGGQQSASSHNCTYLIYCSDNSPIVMATFVIASAITSKYARNVKGSSKSGGGMQYVVVLGLGVGRMVAIKTLGYQEHVSEYGTTWNFFVTLCFVWLIADVIHKYILVSPPERKHDKPSSIWEFFQSIQIPLFCFLVMGVYQYCLTFGNLTDYIIHAPRGTSFFASNREGILSLCGYTPLYLLAEWFSGRYFFTHSSNRNTNILTSASHTMKKDCDPTLVKTQNEEEYQQNCTILQVLLVASGICGVGWYLSAVLLQPTSRRLTNMSFVFMILCLAPLMLAALLVTDMLGRHFTLLQGDRLLADQKRKGGDVLQKLPSTTMELMSKHQLVVFMIANVLTGAINMSMQTLYIPDHFASMIICGYMIVVVLSSWMYDKHFHAS